MRLLVMSCSAQRLSEGSWYDQRLTATFNTQVGHGPSQQSACPSITTCARQRHLMYMQICAWGARGLGATGNAEDRTKGLLHAGMRSRPQALLEGRHRQQPLRHPRLHEVRLLVRLQPTLALLCERCADENDPGSTATTAMPNGPSSNTTEIDRAWTCAWSRRCSTALRRATALHRAPAASAAAAPGRGCPVPDP